MHLCMHKTYVGHKIMKKKTRIAYEVIKSSKKDSPSKDSTECKGQNDGMPKVQTPLLEYLQQRN